MKILWWVAILVVAIRSALLPEQPQTSLVIRAVDEGGRPVRLTRADVYFDVWGGNEVTHLPHAATSVRIGLDRESACRLEPALCANHPTFAARILVEAEGVAPVSSDLFDWMVAPAPALAQSVRIRFPGAAPLVVKRGQDRDVTIRFRARRPRTLRVVDGEAHPIEGVRVSVWNLFADSNHMGAFEGDVLLDDAATDSTGTVAIPDGDIAYGLRLGKPHWEIVRPRSRFWPDQIVRRIDGDSLSVIMRRHARVPLRLKFERAGAPAAGVAVSACVTPCSGACCAPIGTTDASGALSIDDFYPEEFDRIFVPLKDDSYEAIWEIDPRTIRNSRERRLVTLPR